MFCEMNQTVVGALFYEPISSQMKGNVSDSLFVVEVETSTVSDFQNYFIQ